MSSWIIAKYRPSKKTASVTKYHEVTSTLDIFSLYLEFVGSYVYAQKMGESCNVWDENSLLKSTLKTNPQVKYLKEKPEEEPIAVTEYKKFVTEMKFKEIQKLAGSLIVYDAALNQAVIRHLEKAGIRASFDIGIQLVKDPSGPNIGLFKKYAALIKAYQTKAKKDELSVYVMADNYSVISFFQAYCEPSWKIVSLSKNPAKDAEAAFIQSLAEAQIMTAVSSLVLDFSRPADRFIYLMQRNAKMNYFAEINNKEWTMFSE